MEAVKSRDGTPIAFEQAGSVVARDVPTIIVNRVLVDWISPTTDAATVFPETEVRSPFAGQIMGFLAVATERVTSSEPIAWLRTA